MCRFTDFPHTHPHCITWHAQESKQWGLIRPELWGNLESHLKVRGKLWKPLWDKTDNCGGTSSPLSPYLPSWSMGHIKTKVTKGAYGHVTPNRGDNSSFCIITHRPGAKRRLILVVWKLCLVDILPTKDPIPHSHSFSSRVKTQNWTTDSSQACTRVQGGRLLKAGRKGFIGRKLVKTKNRTRGFERGFCPLNVEREVIWGAVRACMKRHCKGSANPENTSLHTLHTGWKQNSSQ